MEIKSGEWPKNEGRPSHDHLTECENRGEVRCVQRRNYVNVYPHVGRQRGGGM